MDQLVADRPNCTDIEVKETTKSLQASKPSWPIPLRIRQPFINRWPERLVDLGLDRKNAESAVETNDCHEIGLAWSLTVTKIYWPFQEGIKQSGVAK